MSDKYHRERSGKSYGTGRRTRSRSRSRSPRRKHEKPSYYKEEIKDEPQETTTNSNYPTKTQNPKIDVKCEPQEVSLKNNHDQKPENIGLGAKNRLKSMGIQMKLGSVNKSPALKPKLTVAAAFNQDSDEEPEEMPPEARMRMKNIGRDTPTSSGPNSFGKTKQGFSDAKKVFEKTLKDAMDSALADD